MTSMWAFVVRMTFCLAETGDNDNIIVFKLKQIGHQNCANTLQ